MLSDVVKEFSCRNKDLRVQKVYSVTNSDGFMPSQDYFSKDVFSKDLSNYKIVRKGMLAYNPSRINVGSVACLQSEDEVIVSPLYVVVEVNEKKLLAEYLNLFLHSDIALEQIKSLTSGSVRDSLKYNAFTRLCLPIPTVEMQRAVIKKLNAIKKLIVKREQQLSKLDQLAKSRFIEMFGHQGCNEKNMPIGKIDDVAEIYLGLTHTPTYVDCGVKFISAKNTSCDYLDLSDVKYISREEFEKVPRGAKPQIGDVLFSRVGSNLGHPVILDISEELCTFVSLGFLRSKGQVTNIYLKYWMKDEFFTEQIKQKVVGGGQPNLNTGWLKEFKIIIPPLELQNEFAAFIEQLDKSKVICNKMHKMVEFSLFRV